MYCLNLCKLCFIISGGSREDIGTFKNKPIFLLMAKWSIDNREFCRKKNHISSFYPMAMISAQSWISQWTANKLFDGECFLTKLLKMHYAYRQKQINRHAWNSHTIWPHIIRVLLSAHIRKCAINKSWTVVFLLYSLLFSFCKNNWWSLF